MELLFLLIVCIIIAYISERKNEKIKKNIRGNIFSKQFIKYQDFEKDWIAVKSGNKGIAGYKYSDRPGCYVITIFNNPVVNDNYTQYDNIYIGQSINMCKRVHNHFNGKGNGDVYADIKYGKYVYVQLVPCLRENLNSVEKKLIQAFNATSSYNKTRGGAKQAN